MKTAIIKVIVIALIIVMIISTSSFVTANTFDPTSWNPGEPNAEDTKTISSMIQPILNTLTVIGIIISVISIMILGVKYIIGSIEERAEYKKSLLPIVLGIFMISSILTIITIIANFASNI